jgi:hypothetical protein
VLGIEIFLPDFILDWMLVKVAALWHSDGTDMPPGGWYKWNSNVCPSLVYKFPPY